MAQKWLLMMLLVVCITKKHQANALGFFSRHRHYTYSVKDDS